MLSPLLIQHGISRDSRLWLWLKIAALLGLIASGQVDVVAVGAWLGWHVSEAWAHRLIALAFLLLYFGGRYDASNLPGGKK